MLQQCGLCGSSHVFNFLKLGRQPLANKYPKSEQFPGERFFSLDVFFCEDCKNVQLGESVSRELMFEDYFYLSSVNGGLVRHFNDFAKTLAGAHFVVDVGSNDGILLRPLKELGVKAIGVEPSINVSKIANDAGLETVCAFFDDDSAQSLLAAHGPADVIVASSVFTHLENPSKFIEAAKILMSKDGALIIEVEYIYNMIRSIQFERFYLDRIFYYSISSLQSLFRRHDMIISDIEEIDQHGGSIRVTVQHANSGVVSPKLSGLIKTELETLNTSALAKFGNTCREMVDALKSSLQQWKDKGVKVAGYGAPARLSTISNFGNIGPDLVPFTVDDSPLKQDRYSPGMHIPIVSASHLESEKAEILIVFAYEYIDDIRSKTGNRYQYYMPVPLKDLG